MKRLAVQNSSEILTFYQRYTKPWREKNPEKVAIYNKTHRDRHKEKRLAANKDWRLANPEKLKIYEETQRQKRAAGGYSRTTYQKEWYETNHGRAKVMLNSSKRRAAKNGWEFDLDLEWLMDKLLIGICEATGVVLSTIRRGNSLKNPWAPSIDRKNSNGGYTKDNCQLTCCMFNLAKSDFEENLVEVMARSYIRKLDQKADK